MKKLKTLSVAMFTTLIVLFCFAFTASAQDCEWIKRLPEDTIEYNFSEATGVIVFRGEGEIYQDYFGTPENRDEIASKIKTVIIEDGIKKIGNYVFSGFPELKNVILPSDFKAIGDYAFSDCKALKNIDFPQFLEDIGKYAFKSSGLEYVYVPEYVCFGGGSFDDCDSMKKIVFTYIWCLVSDCDSLIEIVCPPDMDYITTDIDENPICTLARNCKSLKKITFPAKNEIHNIKVAAASYGTFVENCPNLDSISYINHSLALFSDVDYAVVSKLNKSIKKSKVADFKFTQKGYYNSRLSWSEVDGAGYYQVFYKDGNKWKRVYSGAETEFTCRESGQYRVRAVSYDGKTHVYGKYSTTTVNYVPMVRNMRLEGNILKWDALDNVTGYKIYYLAKDDPAVKVFAKTSKNKIDVSSLGEVRDLMVRAYDKTPTGTLYGGIVIKSMSQLKK